MRKGANAAVPGNLIVFNLLRRNDNGSVTYRFVAILLQRL
jgi:hypothetical protein